MATFPVQITLLVQLHSTRCSSALLVRKCSQQIYPSAADEESGVSWLASAKRIWGQPGTSLHLCLPLCGGTVSACSTQHAGAVSAAGMLHVTGLGLTVSRQLCSLCCSCQTESKLGHGHHLRSKATTRWCHGLRPGRR